MTETRPHTLTGAVLGSYRICNEITSGGMGTVFRAQHVLLGRAAAIKLLRPDLTTDAALVQRFVNEARAVSACKHPGIVEVYDFGYAPDGRAFIVMELLAGESLGRRLAHVRLAEPETVAFAVGIASALKAAHAAGVIHRDLKPDNIFLVADPDAPDGPARTKVLDFGIAKLADAPASRHTQTGALIGTPLYMAPEQARAAGAIDHRADLYSLGCILYHMLVGRPPFLADGSGEVIALQMFAPPQPPSQLTAVTPAMERIVMRLLDKEPTARFGSAAELVAALTALEVQHVARPTWPAGQAALSDSLDTLPHGRVVANPAAGNAAIGDAAIGDAARNGPHGEPPRPAPRTRRGKTLAAAAAVVIGLAAIAGGVAYGVMRSPDAASTSVAGVSATTASASAPSTATAATAPAAAPATTTPSAANATTPSAAPATATAPATAPVEPSTPTAPSTPAQAPGAAIAAVGTPAAIHHSAPSRGLAKHAKAPNAHKPGDAATAPGGDKIIEVIRDAPAADPHPGAHTLDGSPMETSVDSAKHSRAADPANGPAHGQAPRPAPATDRPKDPTLP